MAAGCSQILVPPHILELKPYERVLIIVSVGKSGENGLFVKALSELRQNIEVKSDAAMD